MFVFTENEQESIRFFIQYFPHHYSSDAIYQRISNNKLTQSDLIALDSERWLDEKPESFVLKNDSALFIVNGFSLDYNDEHGYLNITGLLLTK